MSRCGVKLGDWLFARWFGLGFGLVFQVEGDGGKDKFFQGGPVDLVGFMDVNGAADVAIEAGVEEAGRVFERCSFGEGQLDDTIVGLAGADDAAMGEDGSSAPLQLFDDLGVGVVDELADLGECRSAPVAKRFDLLIDECSGGFQWDKPLSCSEQLRQPFFTVPGLVRNRALELHVAISALE